MRDERILGTEKISLKDLAKWSNNVISDPDSSAQDVEKFTGLLEKVNRANVFTEAEIEHYVNGDGRLVVREPVAAKKKKFLGLF